MIVKSLPKLDWKKRNTESNRRNSNQSRDKKTDIRNAEQKVSNSKPLP